MWGCLPYVRDFMAFSGPLACTAKRGNSIMETLKPAKVETTYRHKETGELFKERKDWEAKGYKNEDMAQDVKVIMPSLDFFAKTK